ncbi:hypothetical protein ACFYUV_20855 [Nonomuraea sp. NPDC003560]|uniref:hypothetical protein n=1 Tax=Nonomuraea sp. NPDC003560 TaxID=3364341 RepID=UPI0036A02139
MTGVWLTRTAVARRLGITRDQVEDLIAADVLHLESIAGDHEVISEQSVADYERTRERRPSVRGGDPLPLEIEDEYWKGQDT